MFIIDIKKSVA